MTKDMEHPNPNNEHPRWAPSFFAIWSGQACSLLGSHLVQFAIVWWLAKTTGSATVLAVGGVAALLPVVFLGPFAGALVDRWNRRVVMIAADGMIALCTLVLVMLFTLETVEIWHIFDLVFLRAVGQAFHNPAMFATTALMVPKEHLTRVSGLNQTLEAVMNILAPPLGALLVGILPMAWILSIDIGTALLAILPLCFVHVPQPKRDLTVPSTLFADLREGYRYVTAWRGLFLVCLLFAALNFLLAPLTTLLPLLVTEYFGGQAMTLGVLDAVFGSGMIIGAVTLSIWGGFKRRIVTTLMGIIGVGMCIILLGTSPMVSFGLALAAIFFIGSIMPIAQGPLRALLQAVVSPEKQGRVFSLMGSLVGIAMPAGMMIAGPLADWLSIPALFIINGVVFFSLGIAAFGVPALMKIENHQAAAVRDDSQSA
ncbi:MAG: MFS transporter [Anaerolineales bacterium]|nr:MFS transporter [Anaerolineales bacterium]